MFDVPPKCPALADKLTGLFNWRHTYKVHEKHKGLAHGLLQKSYSLNLPRNVATTNTTTTTITDAARLIDQAPSSLNYNSQYSGAALAKQYSVRE